MDNKSYEQYCETISCPVCGSEHLKPYFKIPYGKLRQKSSLDYSVIGINSDTVLKVSKCKNCAFVFVNPRLKKEYEDLVYNQAKLNKYSKGGNFYQLDDKFYYNARKNRISFFPVLTQALQYIKKSGSLTLFDFGCGVGHSMAMGRGLGINVYGVDIDQKRLALSKAQKFTVCEPEKFMNRYPDVKADIILWQSNIEHLVDLNDGLEKINRLCNKGTILFVNGLTPAVIWIERLKKDFNLAHFVEHINYFPIKTLDRFMGDKGFTPLGMLKHAIIRNQNDYIKYTIKSILDIPWWEMWWYNFRSNFARYYRYEG